LSARRLDPGAASHGSNLPRVVEGQTWLKGTAGNAGKVPAQIAEKLNGRQFADFNDFRKAFWLEVAADPVLSKQFSHSNIVEMKKEMLPLLFLPNILGNAEDMN
jgi:filamentous hemagglutinin